ncbi:hypothetical protein CUN61_07200 [Pseudomonas arsenicoxydans]|uniref:Uncharacterized protein n=1 Tax=Pseudomonas arsenicoxydans TaxID=702115 RepID=A0A4P6FZQ8_9PSED|nr:hypothetical protein CUN61_07200 [Pseudomonas arsenicoxydans]
MQAPRCFNDTGVRPSQASQLPQKPASIGMCSLRLTCFQGYDHVPRPSLQLRVLPYEDRRWA